MRVLARSGMSLVLALLVAVAWGAPNAATPKKDATSEDAPAKKGKSKTAAPKQGRSPKNTTKPSATRKGKRATTRASKSESKKSAAKGSAKKSGGKTGPQGKVTLKLNLKAGESYPVSFTSVEKVTEKVGPDKEETGTRTIGFSVTFTPSKVEPDGAVHGTYAYDAVRIAIQTPNTNLDYDSARGGPVPDDLNAEALAVFVGKKVDVVLTPHGKIQALTGADKIVAAVVESTGLPAAIRGNIDRQLIQRFGEHAIRANLEQLTAIFPERPVEVGETWEVEQKQVLNRGELLTGKATSTFKSAVGGKVTLEIKGGLKTEPGAPGPEPDSTVSLDGTYTGTIEIDQASGWISAGDIRKQVRGSKTRVFQPGAHKAEFPMTFSAETAFTRGGN